MRKPKIVYAKHNIFAIYITSIKLESDNLLSMNLEKYSIEIENNP